jgi:hypothetical protein
MPLSSHALATTCFRTTVHGTVFARRTQTLRDAVAGDELLLIPDPPDADEPAVWVHVRGGDPLGHLPPEINAWLAPWMLRGGAASATVLRIGGSEVPSWKRLLIEVRCRPRGEEVPL